MTHAVSRRASARRMGYLATLVALAVLAIVVVDAIRTNNNNSSQPQLPFASNSVWNAPLAASAPLSPQSSTYVSELQQQVTHYGAWINTTQFSVPVYTVGASQRRVPVVLDTHGGSGDLLAREFQQGVPIPPGAQPAAGSDRHMVVWQPSTDTLWEFWNMERVDGAWHARWGGKMMNVSASPGYFTNPKDWGGSATSLSLLGGLIRPSELRAGHIDHALALAIPHAAAGSFVAPAQRTDGNDRSQSAIPEGTRFRLNPKIDVGSLHLPPVTRELALAAQRYGMVLRDQSGSVSVYAEDPTHLGKNPYQGTGGLFGPYNPAQLMRAFPWQDLQVAKPTQ
jgi:hypothetical protein